MAGNGAGRIILQTCRRILQFTGLASCIIHALAGSVAFKNLAHLQLDVKVASMNGSKNIGK
jgi:hypothetical protein